MTTSRQEIQNRVDEIIAVYGCELIEFKVFFSNGITTLRCFIDYPEGGINLDTCVKVNKRISAYVDESNCLGEKYTVEVNSPGLDRPLKCKNDFRKVRGKPVSLWFKELVLGKPSLDGEVADITDKELVLIYKDKELKIDFNNIKLGKEKL